MPIESATYVADLTPSNPLGSDPAGQGDDHLRLIKSVLLATFPNMGAVMGKIQKLDTAQTISAGFNTGLIISSTSATTTVILTLPAVASITSGWHVNLSTQGNYAIFTPPAGASINGAATFTLPPNSNGLLVYDGGPTTFRAFKWPNGAGQAELSTINLTGGQIVFPATAVPSTNANTLDDYEEGTFTPTLTIATPGNLVVAYSTQLGHYTKIGNLVTVRVSIATSTFTHTTSSGNIQVTGIPFAPTSNSWHAVVRSAVFNIATPALPLNYGLNMVGVIDSGATTYNFALPGIARNAETPIGHLAHTTGDNVQVQFTGQFQTT